MFAPAGPSLTYFPLSAQHPLLAWQPHSCMSCECQLVARVHCLRWKVICHCAAVALQPNGSSSILSRTHSSSVTVSLTGSGAEGHSHRLRLVLASQPNATFRKRDPNNPACLLACLWHKDTLQDWGFCGCVSEWVTTSAPSLLPRLSRLLCNTRHCDLEPGGNNFQFLILAWVKESRANWRRP